MMQQIAFVVKGPPVPKARARVVTRDDGKKTSFTPGKTAAYESLVGTHALCARMRSSSKWPWNDPKARFGIAISIFKSRDQGDLDNFEKSIWDACNKVVWLDDRQVIRRGDGGMYACAKGQERAEVRIWIVEANQ